jgi:cell division protein FtsI/penicillin-binding protein 2
MGKDKIQSKIKISLKIITYALLIITFKLWYLTVIKNQEKLMESKIPQKKNVLQLANRGAIYDRYNTPLAINRIRYSASIYYAQIRQLPTFIWERDKNNKKKKKYIRKEHIKKLSNLLAKELDLKSERVEDLIHSKACLFPHIPFVIKENISEEKYYKLKMLERDFLGLHAKISEERFYPFKKTASDLIGYMGSISQKKYFSMANEIKSLKNLLTQENPKLPSDYKNLKCDKKKLKSLQKKSYRINDLLGKSGIEYVKEELLRGSHGKKTFSVDVKGNFLKKLKNSKKPTPGKNIYLSISKELQLFSEKLLSENEKLRDNKSKTYNPIKKELTLQKQPLIKGGAIIAMDPNSGEILAFASYPRFDPNDFIPSPNKKEKQKNILNWLELPKHIENIWNNKNFLKRELYDFKEKKFFEEKKNLNFEYFLELILDKNSPIFSSFEKLKNIKNAISLQENTEALLYFSKEKNLKELLSDLFSQKSQKNFQGKISFLKNKISPYLENIKNSEDKIVVIDICRLVVNSPSFSNELIEKVGHITLFDYFDLQKKYIIFEDFIKKTIKPLFHEKVFKEWRKKNQKAFLKAKRKEEKLKKRYARPYLNYLDEKENKLFNKFFEKYKILFATSLIKKEVLAKNSLNIYFDELKKNLLKEEFQFLKNFFKNFDFDTTYNLLKTIRPFSKLDRPLYGTYKNFRKQKIYLEKDLATSFYPINGFGYGRSFVFNESTPLGSIFKIITSYAALETKYKTFAKKNFFPKKINPMTMTDIKKWDKKGYIVGYSENNKPYPTHYKRGRLISSTHPNIGKIDLISALAQSSNPYFSILAGDFLKDPNDLIKAAKNFNIGKKTKIDLRMEFKGNLPNDLKNKTSLYSFAIGQHTLTTTPLQVAVMLSALANKGFILKPQILKTHKKKIRRKIFLPASIRNTILEGLDQVIWGERGTARPTVIRHLKQNPKILEEYKNLKHQFIGKTSTAEIMHKCDIIPSKKAQKYKHIWFGGISFEPSKKRWEKPELVVVVFLRFGDVGREAAPLAAAVVNKYRELKKKYENF